MPLVEVRCPSCHAPVEAPSNTPTTKCRFCGASLREAAAAPTVHMQRVACLVLDRVGPSNFARAWDILTKVGRFPPDVAERAIRSSPGEVGSLDGFEGRDELILALKEAGITARVEARSIEVPPPPRERSVHLETVGANKGAVMKIIRERLECGAYEAKAFVDKAPSVLVAALVEDRAKTFAEALESAGATVRLDEPLISERT